MPRIYKPRPTGLDPCLARSDSEFAAAAGLLGETAVLGAELSFELQVLAVNPTHPSRDLGNEWMRNAFVLLQGMLVAERWLIEFLTGPATRMDPNTQKRRKVETDICVDCFLYDWRFPPGQLANEMVARLQPINTLAAHPTWAQVTASPRQWTLTRIASCIEGLDLFAKSVYEQHPNAATVLQERVGVARGAMGEGRPDGLRWFDLVAASS